MTTTPRPASLPSSSPSFGVLLRHWRELRRMTQGDLALAADSSTRHLSCLETAKAQPSREMIHRLAELLEVPLRERNSLLLAAGFAPAFQEHALEELQAAKAAMEHVLRAHRPYPAFAIDRYWNMVLSNDALPQLYEGCAPQLLRPPVNALRLLLHPQGMGPRILNFGAWRAHTLSCVRERLAARADPVLQALFTEVAGYPEPEGAAQAGFAGADQLAMPLRVATRLGNVCFLGTVTVFGAAHDITLSELALEMFFPADDQTARIVNRMVEELARQARAAG